MRRDYQINKFKLQRRTGREIWGDHLTRHGRFLRFRKKNPWAISRKVVNFVIQEFERRVVFDYPHRYSSFGKDRRIIHPNFLRFIRLRGRLIFTRIIKGFTKYFFSSLKGPSGVWFSHETKTRLRRLQQRQGEVKHLARRLKIQKPIFAGDEPWVPITQILLNYMYAWRKQKRHPDYAPIESFNKSISSLSTKYPYVFLTIHFPKTIMQVLSEAIKEGDILKQKKLFKKGLSSIYDTFGSVVFDPEAFNLSFTCDNKITVQSRWHHPTFLQVWPKHFGNVEMPQFVGLIENFVEGIRERFLIAKKAKLPWVYRYDLNRVTKYKDNFYFSWKLMINSSSDSGNFITSYYKRFLLQALELEKRRSSSTFFNLWEWVFRVFPERWRPKPISAIPLSVGRAMGGVCQDTYTNNFSVYTVSTFVTKRFGLNPFFEANKRFYGDALAALSNRIFSSTAKTTKWLCDVANMWTYVNIMPEDYYVETNWVPSIFSRLSTQKKVFPILQQALGFVKALRKRQRDLSISAIKRRMQDFRNFILRLDYSNLRVAFGDYEDGFRIPSIPGDQYRKSKKQYRLLEKFRLETFYGIFDPRLFLEKYHALFNRDTDSVPGKTYQLLECRLIFLLHRTNVFSSMYFLDQMIMHGNLVFEGDVVRDPHVVVGVGHRLFVPLSYYWYAMNVYIRKTFSFRNILNAPMYLEMNYVLLALTPIMLPMRQQLTFPFSTHKRSFDPSSVVRRIVR